jgi:hypothetical protein
LRIGVSQGFERGACRIDLQAAGIMSAGHMIDDTIFCRAAPRAKAGGSQRAGAIIKTGYTAKVAAALLAAGAA